MQGFEFGRHAIADLRHGRSVIATTHKSPAIRTDNDTSTFPVVPKAPWRSPPGSVGLVPRGTAGKEAAATSGATLALCGAGMDMQRNDRPSGGEDLRRNVRPRVRGSGGSSPDLAAHEAAAPAPSGGASGATLALSGVAPEPRLTDRQLRAPAASGAALAPSGIATRRHAPISRDEFVRRGVFAFLAVELRRSPSRSPNPLSAVVFLHAPLRGARTYRRCTNWSVAHILFGTPHCRGRQALLRQLRTGARLQAEGAVLW